MLETTFRELRIVRGARLFTTEAHRGCARMESNDEWRDATVNESSLVHQLLLRSGQLGARLFRNNVS